MCLDISKHSFFSEEEWLDELLSFITRRSKKMCVLGIVDDEH
jgi:hypothetical protein